VIVRTAMVIFCRNITINKPEVLKQNGPLLLACNHPNSFLDGVILDALFRHPVYSLTRGDVFKKPFYIKLLRALKLLPVFRISEGAENLNSNYETFDSCIEIFKKNGIVIIFSEGKCINEWHLRPLKKGTARLAFSSWDEGLPLTIIPVGINYSSFTRFGKNLFINFGEPIRENQFRNISSDGLRNQAFNDLLESQLKDLVFEIDKRDKLSQQKILQKNPSVWQKILLFLPAILGWLSHVLLYLPLRTFTFSKTKHNDHFDSVMTALLVFTYPFYIILITLLAYLLTKSPMVLGLILILPFTAWAYVQLKPQLDQ
jgi:1-acyl-sn-glycerol-3-phosphate acyltransferase